MAVKKATVVNTKRNNKAVEEQLEIPSVVARLEAAVLQLKRTLAELSSRLTPVTASDFEFGSEEVPEGDSCETPLGQQLEDVVADITAQEEFIRAQIEALRI